MDDLIDINGLCKGYSAGGTSYSVLKRLDLRLDAGESMCIFGASGSGKTTLLEMLGLLSRSNAGSHRFLGTEVTRMSDRELTHRRRNNIGFVFQSFHLLTHLSVLDNVCLPARYTGARRARKKARALLSELGLGHRLMHRPTHLSGGEQQRVAIARALMNTPRLLIADEPTGNLDPDMSRHIIDLLLQRQDQGTAVVVVTHDTTLGNRFERRARLQDGKLVEGAVPA